MGRVCEKHGQWCPDGECRWCDAPEVADPFAGQRWVQTGDSWAAQPDPYLDGIRRAYDAASAVDRQVMIDTMERRLKKAEQSLLHDFHKRFYGPAEGPNDGHGIFE